jgi:hypothetical protein
MTKAVRNHPLILWERQRNRRIARKRAPVERTYSFLDRINNSHTKLTTIERNHVQITILMMLFNTEQLITLEKQEKKQNANKENEKEEDNTISYLKFFQNNTIYSENSSLINFLIQTSINEEIRKSKKRKLQVINKENIPRMSKSDYRRQTKRKLAKMRKPKNKKNKKEYKNLLTSINEFNLTPIRI